MNVQLKGTVEIHGTAAIPDFWKWKLEWAVEGSEKWHSIGEEHFQPVTGGFLDIWNTDALPGAGLYRLKLTIADKTGNYPVQNVCEVRVTVGR